MAGYVAISRSLWSDPDFDDGPMSQREAWIWLIAEAAWKPHKVRRNNAIIELQRGQVAHSIRFIAEAWGWHRARVERFLKTLKNRDMIETATETGVSVITICNYDKYQAGEKAAETPVSEKRDTSETNYKKDNHKNQIDTNVSKARKRATRLPEDWQIPEEWIDEAVSRGLTRAGAYAEAERMRNWSLSSPKGAKLDWRASWRNWIRDKADQPAKPADRHRVATDVRRDAWMEAVADAERGVGAANQIKHTRGAGAGRLCLPSREIDGSGKQDGNRGPDRGSDGSLLDEGFGPRFR